MSPALPSVYPLIQAPMAGVQDNRLALAVCRAGGLGSIPAALLSAEALAAQLAALAAATSAPVNVNFFAHTLPAADEAAESRWCARLQPYLQHYGIDAAAITPGVLRRPFAAEQLAVLQQYRPAVVSFHFGLPENTLLRAVKDTGARVLASATTVAEAQWLADNGADVVIAQGSEAGGHRATFLGSDPACQVGTLALVAQVVDAVDAVAVPVVAAGGLADARGIRAALALGAAGVQLRTAYLLCDEALTPPLHRAALRQAAAAPATAETAITNVFSGKPARGLVNTLMRELGYLCDAVAPFPYAASAVNALRSRAEAAGDSGFTPLWCGQNPGGCRETGAEALTRELCRAFAAA